MTQREQLTRVALPGPRPGPLLGWRRQLLSFARDPIGFAGRLFERYGDIAAVQHGNNQLVFVLGPAYNQALLAEPDSFRSAIGVSAVPASAGLKAALQTMLEQPDTDWERTYAAIVVETTHSLIQHWGIGQQLDAAWTMQRLCVRIAARALWGLERAEDAAALLQATGEWRAASPARLVLDATSGVPGTPFHSVTALARRVEQVVANAYAGARSRGERPYASDSLLARLRSATNAPEEEVLALLAHLFAAGYPSSAAGLTWTLFLLTQHVGVQAELHDEARRVVPAAMTGDARATQPALLGRTVRESLRLLPPCAFGMRSAAAGAALGGYALPRDAMVVYSPYLTHRLPELFYQPHKFRPERWLHVEPSPAEYLPFGGGPRAMLGARLAELEIRLVLGVILSRFVFALLPGARIDTTVRFALMPRGAVPLLVSPPDRPVRQREAHGDVLKLVGL